MTRSTAGFIDTRLNGAANSKTAAKEELEEAERTYEALKVELERLVNGRSAFRDELTRAVAEGERLLSGPRG